MSGVLEGAGFIWSWHWLWDWLLLPNLQHSQPVVVIDCKATGMNKALSKPYHMKWPSRHSRGIISIFAELCTPCPPTHPLKVPLCDCHVQSLARDLLTGMQSALIPTAPLKQVFAWSAYFHWHSQTHWMNPLLPWSDVTPVMIFIVIINQCQPCGLQYSWESGGTWCSSWYNIDEDMQDCHRLTAREFSWTLVLSELWWSVSQSATWLLLVVLHVHRRACIYSWLLLVSCKQPASCMAKAPLYNVHYSCTYRNASAVAAFFFVDLIFSPPHLSILSVRQWSVYFLCAWVTSLRSTASWYALIPIQELM